MNYEEFKQEVADRIKEFLPEKYENADVSIQTVVKNNDQKLDGLMVKLEDSNIAPNIYLNQFYEQHEDGRPMDDILAAIADEFCPPVKIIDAVTEIISWDIVEPNIFWEDDLECIALEWECPVGYLTVNVYSPLVSTALP